MKAIQAIVVVAIAAVLLAFAFLCAFAVFVDVSANGVDAPDPGGRAAVIIAMTLALVFAVMLSKVAVQWSKD